MWLVSFTYSKGMATCPPKHVPKHAGLAQLGERQTEDLKVMCSIHITCNFFFGIFWYQSVARYILIFFTLWFEVTIT
jgi:hypothetical protein